MKIRMILLNLVISINFSIIEDFLIELLSIFLPSTLNGNNNLMETQLPALEDVSLQIKCDSQIAASLNHAIKTIQANSFLTFIFI